MSPIPKAISSSGDMRPTSASIGGHLPAARSISIFSSLSRRALCASTIAHRSPYALVGDVACATYGSDWMHILQRD
ncbi:Os11g0197301 [Oryza sativa Japonica Group]|uniref:Os11g0197301 protein n=1 Tax=Oryza sativa subsp. japonica TaxID=39947 RepID=A0A0P0XZQ7_ORYSJ|nr:Os11g0197301 [Oryza sativa Japonica Group]